MKRFVFLVLGSLFFVCLGHAQTDKQVDVNDYYVYSKNGFAIKEGSFKQGKKTYYYKGIYSVDGKVCVKALPLADFNGGIIIVAPGTEVVTTNACTYSGTHHRIMLPKSVKTLSSGAFANDITNITIYDEAEITEHKTEE